MKWYASLLSLGIAFFIIGCGDSAPRAVIDSSDLEGIREYEANQKKIEAVMLADEDSGADPDDQSDEP